MIEKIAYWVAVLTVVSVPPAVVYWYLIHPFAKRWRRLGPTWTLVIVGLLCVGLGVVLFQFREPLLRYRGPLDLRLALVGLPLIITSMWLEIQIRRHLKFSILVGIPELAKERGVLLTEGIYARSRNPRYVGITIAMFGYALLLNYVAVWVMAVLMPLAIYLLVRLEESELRERFGDEYRDYCARVPRFLPHFGRAGARGQHRTRKGQPAGVLGGEDGDETS